MSAASENGLGPAASPVATRVAASEGIDLSSVHGSGPHGRIVKEDVLAAAGSSNGRTASGVPITPGLVEELAQEAEAGYDVEGMLHRREEGVQTLATPSKSVDMRVDWLAEMLLLRRFEEEAQRQYQASKVGGFLHLGIGEEATTVGAVAALRKQDYLIGAYRTHGYALARGTEPRAVMAELFGRSTGCSGGRGGSMHTFDGERRYLGGYGIVGGQVPLAGGLAMAIHLSGKDEVVMCQLGDGATDEGVFAETLNMSSLWDCPILFLVSNNYYSMGTALPRHSARPQGVELPRLSERGQPYGIEGRNCDGMDVQDVYDTCRQALEDVREQQRPIIVEAMTYRFRGHSVADPQRYRTKDEVVEQQQRDPISALSQQLISEGRASDEGVAALDDAATRVVADAVRFAEDSPFPDNETLYDHVYSESDATQGAIERRAWDPVNDSPQGELHG